MDSIKIELPQLDVILERLDRIEEWQAEAAEAPPPDIRLVSRSELARIVGVSPVTIGRWADRGLIHGYVVGTRRRYRLDEVLVTLRKNTEMAQD